MDVSLGSVVKENNIESNSSIIPEAPIRRYSTAKRDETGAIIRGYEGIDMKEVYAQKSITYKLLKRFFDIVLSIAGIILLSPLFLIVSIMIKAADGGPVIFAVQRWGKNFKYFPMYKFRTMCVGAEQMTKEVITDKDINGMAYKIVDDPRMTKLGKFLRHSSIDELPQLWNVLKGEMSLVGPRPIQTTRADGDDYELQRWCVKPGITCIWQIDGRSEVSWDEWVEMDLQYISEMGLWTDLKILLGTIGAVLYKVGAV